jgi:hypothetical protein
MEEDGNITPGSKGYWDVFYNTDGGPLVEKQRQINRKESSGNKDAVDSVVDRYEWFTTFDVCEDSFLDALRETFLPAAGSSSVRVLHIGCGNSAFCDSFGFLKVAGGRKGKAGKGADVNGIPTDILNVDICEGLIDRLQAKYPGRKYAVCDCCDMVISGDDAPCLPEWYVAGPVCRVGESLVEIVFDKGTIDALLSAFPGEDNPNAARYCVEVLRVLRVGGIVLLISINSIDVLLPYFMSADVSRKSFELCFKREMDVSHQFEGAYDPSVAALRIETLGTRYSMYVFRVVSSD